MSERVDTRKDIEDALKAFGADPLLEAANGLFSTLGYASQRNLPIATAEQFFEQLDPGNKLTDKQREPLLSLKSLHLLFQLTGVEFSTQKDLFDDPNELRSTQIESYLFFAAELPPGQYTRTALSTLVRSINKPLPMPALVLFRHSDAVSLGIIHRRLSKRDQAKDVLEKVTLIKDINFADPIRAHLEILNDFALANLDADFGVSNFVRLHEAWQKRLGMYALSNEFYREIADWYFWAHHQVEDGTIRLPQHCDTEQEQSLFLIRLLTRVIFCWFLVEKRLIPSDLFREHWLKPRLKGFAPSRDPMKPDTSPTYYHAILQNLFFGTLNMPSEQRDFREKKKEGQRYDKNHGITNLWRYESDFRDAKDWIAVCQRIPFLNGGLFDCLDDKTASKKDNFILDGFSDNPKLGCDLPNDLFFGPERNVDLSRDYGEDTKKTARSKKAKVRGLIEILSRYKFTVEENTPLEEEIALDPELLGKVFENLLASYNEDTRTTARKALGAFYTPREIVGYMVDEALTSYLSTQVPRCKSALDDLFSNKATLKEIKPDTRDALIAAIGRVKILDPACGSGAFPMGALHRLVDLLQKLDPDNDKWRDFQRLRAVAETDEAFKSGDRESREHRLKEINDTFEFNSSDYGRKLYLIENSIYGVDIQPIATQIAKLRFFIALVVEQTVNPRASNLGVLPLPNLETRIVAADTLIPIEKQGDRQLDLLDQQIKPLRMALELVRHEHFNARSPTAKRAYRAKDAQLRGEIADLLRDSGLPATSAKALAAWDPYDQNEFAPFFDSEWMFGLPVGKMRLDGKAALLRKFALINETDGQTELTAGTPPEIDSGFDIVISNPPYVRHEKISDARDKLFPHYETAASRVDLFVFFFERAHRLLKENGVLCFISSNKYFRAAYGEKLRRYLAGKMSILSIVDFGDAPVFKAIAYASIFVGRQHEPSSGHSVRTLTWPLDEPLEHFAARLKADADEIPQANLKPDGWNLTAGTGDLLQQIEARGTPLKSFVNGRLYRGIITGLNDAFVIDADTRQALIQQDRKSAELIQPWLRGRDVKRWNTAWAELYAIVFPFGFHTELSSYPAVLKHLKRFETQLRKRGQCTSSRGGKNQGQHHWLELDNNPKQSYLDEFKQPKVIIPAIERACAFAFDEDSYYSNDKTTICVSEQAKFLCGVLNSSVIWWVIRQIAAERQNGYYEFKPMYCSRLPVASASKSQKTAIEQLVDLLRHLDSHFARNPSAQTTRDPLMVAYWERVLNGLVYELYFPEELHAAGLRLFNLVDQAGLPNVDKLADSKKLPALREAFQEFYDSNHLVRIALDLNQAYSLVL